MAATPFLVRPRAFGTGRERERASGVNVSEYERLACIVGGSALGLYGLLRGTWGGLALAGLGADLVYRGVTGNSLLYRALGLSTADRPRGPMASVPAGRGVRVDQTITIARPPEELYRFWRNLENLPRIMSHLQAVTVLDDWHSHWVTRGPMGTHVSWDAVIHTERPPELISWRSLEGSAVDTAGSVHFLPTADGQGTRLRVELKYHPLGGKVGAAIARLFGESAEQQIEADLQRFKRQIEAGTIPIPGGQTGVSAG